MTLKQSLFSGFRTLAGCCKTRSLWSVAVIFASSLFAAETNNPAHPPGNRYLIVVETSRAMRDRTEGVLKAVQQLLSSNIGGQLKRGDTLGLWTYNEELYAGRFPLQFWSEQAQVAITAGVLNFLQQQHFEKRGTLQTVMPSLERVVKDSHILTIILLSDGEQKIYFTPFDQKINDTFEQWKKQQQQAHMPFVTVLRAKDGRITDFSVVPAPWPIEIPPLPLEPKVVQQPDKKAGTNVAKAQPSRPMLPPLFLSGRKTNDTAKTAAASATNSNPAPTAPPLTNQATAEAISAPALNTAPSIPASTQAPGQLPVPVPNSQTTERVEPAPTVSSPAGTGANTPEPTAGSAPVPSAPIPANSIAPGPLGPKTTDKRGSADPAGQTTAAIREPSGPAPIREPASTSQPPATHPSSAPTVAVTAQPASSRLVWMGTALVAAVILVALLGLSRWRSSRHVSLITRSMNRNPPK